MTTFWAVIAGTLVFVFGQAIVRFILEPIRAQKVIVADIAFALIYVGNIGPVPAHIDINRLALVESHREVTARVRALSGRMTASLAELPWYPLWQRMGWVKSAETIGKANRLLLQWANSVYSGDPHAARCGLAACLGLNVLGTEPAPSVRMDERGPTSA